MKKQLTSAQANNLLKQLNEEFRSLLYRERQSRVFVAATTEDREEARPEYDYAAVQAQLAAIEGKIRRVKHTINVFNITHVVEGFGMTVDQLLLCIQQLRDRKTRLDGMCDLLPKTRIEGNVRSNLIEYRYANYDPSAAKADFLAASDELARAQIALDTLNNSVTMEIDLDD